MHEIGAHRFDAACSEDANHQRPIAPPNICSSETSNNAYYSRGEVQAEFLLECKVPLEVDYPDILHRADEHGGCKSQQYADQARFAEEARDRPCATDDEQCRGTASDDHEGEGGVV